MAPSPLTPIAEEPRPDFPSEIKIHHESNSGHKPSKDDRGCVFFYDRPTLMGNFHDDSFFRDAQESYEQAVKDLLQRVHGNSQPSYRSNMALYKDMRDKNQVQENQVYGLTEQEDKYQIVVDVQGYSATDVSVKAVGDQELVVEGKRIETSPDGKSVTQSFSRRFALPGLVKLEAVSSALSKDGILTVTAPKLYQTENNVPSVKPGYQGQQNMQPSVAEKAFPNNFFDERQKMSDQHLSNMLGDLDINSRNKFQSAFDKNVLMKPMAEAKPNNYAPEMIEELENYKIVLDIKGYLPNDISVKAVGDRELLIEGNHKETSVSGAESSKCFNRRFCLPGLVKLEAITSSLSPDGKLTIRAPKKQEPVAQNAVTNQSHLHGVPVSDRVQQNSQNFSTVYKTESEQPPIPRDSFNDFFGDDEFGMEPMMMRRNPSSFLEQAHNEYEENLRNMRNRHWAVEPSQPRFFSDFPMMQHPVATEANSDILESENDYKMKLDVKNYSPKDISVKAVGDRDLLIEGRRVDKQPGKPEMSQSFTRKFSLPGLVKMEAITSSLSPDGTLTITAPKAPRA